MTLHCGGGTVNFRGYRYSTFWHLIYFSGNGSETIIKLEQLEPHMKIKSEDKDVKLFQDPLEFVMGKFFLSI